MRKMLTRNRETSTREREEMIEKPTKEQIRDEAMCLVQGIAGTPANWRENVTSGIERASRLTGYPVGTVRKIWYGERAVIPAEIMDWLRRVSAEQAARTRREIEAANALLQARERHRDAIRTKQARRFSGLGRAMASAGGGVD